MNVKKMNKEQLIAKVDELQARVDNLMCQAKEADELNEEKASAIDNFKSVIDKLNTEVITLSKDLQEARTKVASISNDAQGMESRIAELTAINSKLKVWKPIAIGAIVAFLISLCVIIA